MQVGRLVDEIERLGYGDNTLIFYIWGDNGSSAEGQNGTISELLAQNGIPTTVEQHIKALDELGGLDVLGSPKTDNMYHAGWALGRQHALQGDEAPGLALRRHAQPDGRPLAGEDQAGPDAARRSSTTVNDIVPTIYEIVGITPPRVVNGVPQDPIDGVSFAYTFDDPKAKGAAAARSTSRSWAAAPSTTTAGWRRPSARASRGCRGCPRASASGRPTRTRWELYNLDEDWSQANDLAGEDAGEARAAEGAVPDRGGEEQGAADRRRPLDSGPPPRAAHRAALHASGPSRATSCACRSSARRRWATSRTS